MGLKLRISTRQNNYTLLFDSSTQGDRQSPVLNGYACDVTLVNLTFNKQMYQPGKIVARLQITSTGATQDAIDKSYFLLNQDFLKKEFKGATVTLEDEKNGPDNTMVIAQSYKVYEVMPTYTSTSLYVDLVIYSPDMLLKDEGIKSAAYVAKKFGEDIFKTKINACNNIDLSGKGEVALQCGLKYIVNDGKEDKVKEYIQPYLVQYQETFYDFLIRTANRWGEFVYYEDGKLILGRKIFYKPKKESDGTIQKDEKGETLYTEDVDIQSITSYKSISYMDERSGMTKEATGKQAVVTDDYLEEITKGDFIKHAGDQKAHDSVYNHRIMQSFVSMKGNVFDWVLDTFPKEANVAAGNERIMKKKNAEFEKCFPSQEEQYEGNSGRQFATYKDDGGLTVDNYSKIRDNEYRAAENVLYIDMDSYQHLRLGDVISLGDNSNQYLVIGVACSGAGAYRVKAIKPINDIFYPLTLPTGHVRTSGPQRATVVDTYDPKLNGRYRVKFIWDNANTASPWLRVSREMASNKSGAVWQLEKDTEVLLDFVDNNVELPYIAGALQSTEAKKNSRSTLYNQMDLTTPAGHAIRMTDGDGGGFDSFLSSFTPIWDMIQTANPDRTGSAPKIKDSKYYEGGVAITDRFGVYSIKASTNKRNISISSPWGDVNINAFTGITISAPNGDVKIQGKNVSIEAGNNVSIVSGKNIANGLFGSAALTKDTFKKDMAGSQFLGVANASLNAIAGKALGILDIPVMRHFLEVLLRPVSGRMQLSSNRSISLKAKFDAEKTNEGIVDFLHNARTGPDEANDDMKKNIFSWLCSKNNILGAFSDDFVSRGVLSDKWRANVGPDTGNIVLKADNIKPEGHAKASEGIKALNSPLLDDGIDA